MRIFPRALWLLGEDGLEREHILSLSISGFCCNEEAKGQCSQRQMGNGGRAQIQSIWGGK